MQHRPDVVEDILLIHTGVRAVLKCGEVAVVVHGSFFHPGVDRKGVQLVQTKQQEAVGDLSPDAAQLHDMMPCAVGVHRGERGEIESTVTDGAGGVNQVGRAVAGAQEFQIGTFERRKRFRRGERIQHLSVKNNGFPQRFAESGQDGADARDVVALRDQQGAQRFPRILPQDADTAAVVRRRFGKCIDRKRGADGRIVQSAVKIGTP